MLPEWAMVGAEFHLGDVAYLAYESGGFILSDVFGCQKSVPLPRGFLLCDLYGICISYSLVEDHGIEGENADGFGSAVPAFGLRDLSGSIADRDGDVLGRAGIAGLGDDIQKETEIICFLSLLGFGSDDFIRGGFGLFAILPGAGSFER